MEKYSKAVSEMYSQFEKREARPMEKYVGRLARCSWGGISDVVGYTVMHDGSFSLIVDCPPRVGWSDVGPNDVIFKECERYWYVRISDLID